MALRTVAAKLKAPVASLKQAWAAKHPFEGLNVDPIIRQEMEELQRAKRAKEMKETLVSIAFMGGSTGLFLHALHSDLAAREAEAAVREALYSDEDFNGGAVNAVSTNKD